MKAETIVIPTPFKKSFERAAHTMICHPFNRNISIVESRNIDEYTHYLIEYEREGDLFNLGIMYNDINSSENNSTKIKTLLQQNTYINHDKRR